MTSSAENEKHCTDNTENGFFTHIEEWNRVEELVLKHKKQFAPDATEKERQEADRATTELLKSFYPLFRKYTVLLKSGHVDFTDGEMKRFVLGFIGDKNLKAALKKDRQSKEIKHQIMLKFNFVRETYGRLDEEDIMTDLQMLLLVLAKRYKQMGRNFCAYTYNAFSFEVSRHVKKFINNPANITYRNCQYEEYMEARSEQYIEDGLIDKTYENNIGIPDMSWIQGTSCSNIFEFLTPVERKILVKYYLEHYNDRQIAEELGLHINTVNQKRRAVVAKLAQKMDIDITDMKRSRNTGNSRLTEA